MGKPFPSAAVLVGGVAPSLLVMQVPLSIGGALDARPATERPHVLTEDQPDEDHTRDPADRDGAARDSDTSCRFEPPGAGDGGAIKTSVGCHARRTKPAPHAWTTFSASVGPPKWGRSGGASLLARVKGGGAEARGR